MARLLIPNGEVREMEDEDLPKIIEMSTEEDIIKFWFVTEVKGALEKYWKKRLEIQKDYRSRRGWIRQTYYLPIEEENTVKGLLSLHIAPYRIIIGKGDSKELRHYAEVSYFVGKKYQRKGLASKVLEATIPFVFNEIKAGAIGANCLKENYASQELLLKSGLLKKAEMISERTESKGREVVVYGISYEEYFSSLLVGV